MSKRCRLFNPQSRQIQKKKKKHPTMCRRGCQLQYYQIHDWTHSQRHSESYILRQILQQIGMCFLVSILLGLSVHFANFVAKFGAANKERNWRKIWVHEKNLGKIWVPEGILRPFSRSCWQLSSNFVYIFAHIGSFWP